MGVRTLFFHRIASNALQSEGHFFTFSEGIDDVLLYVTKG